MQFHPPCRFLLPWLLFYVWFISCLGCRSGCKIWYNEKPWCGKLLGRTRLLVASVCPPKEKGTILFHKHYCLNIQDRVHVQRNKCCFNKKYICDKPSCQLYFENSFLQKMLVFSIKKAIKIAHNFQDWIPFLVGCWRLVVKINRYFYFLVYMNLFICVYFWKLNALMVLWGVSSASIISNHSSILQSWIIKHLLWPHYLWKTKNVYISILKTKIP